MSYKVGSFAGSLISSQLTQHIDKHGTQRNLKRKQKRDWKRQMTKRNPVSVVKVLLPTESSRSRPKPGPERALLKQRDFKVDIDSKLGKTFLVAGPGAPSAASSGGAVGGYFCNVCDCVLKDSISYLDHLNGKNRMFLPPWFLMLSCHLDFLCSPLECLTDRPAGYGHVHARGAVNSSASARSAFSEQAEARGEGQARVRAV